MTKIYSLDKLDPIAVEAVRGSTAQAGIYVTPMLIRRFKGDGNTTIIFKRLLYCSEQWADEEGWFFQTAATVERVTGLGNRALQRSINRLEKMGLIEKKLGGIPYKAYYRVNLSAYLELIRTEASFATSGKASSAPSDETSLATSDETSLITRGKEVILSDPISDTKSDTYTSANADSTSTETDSDLPIPTEKKPPGYVPGPGKLVACEDPDTGEEVGEPDWRFPQTQVQHQAFNATGRIRFGSKAEWNKMQRIEKAIDDGEMPHGWWNNRVYNAEQHSWSFPKLLQYTLNVDRQREWERENK